MDAQNIKIVALPNIKDLQCLLLFTIVYYSLQILTIKYQLLGICK